MKEICLIVEIFLIDIWFQKSKADMNSLSLETTQLLRGVACIMIVFGHCTALNHDSFLSQFNVGWYCVAFFMFISGWGVAYSFQHKQNYISYFWKSRLIKIGVPFLSVHILYIAIKNIFGIRYTIRDILMGLLGQCTVVDNSWYPVAILILYALFWISFKIPTNTEKRLMMLTALVSFVTIIEFGIMGPRKDWWYISNLAFVEGVLIHTFDDKFLYLKKYLVLGILGFCFAYCMIPFFNSMMGKYIPLIYVTACNLRSSFLILFLISVTVYFGPRCKILEKIGDISYEVYLTHGLFIFIFGHYWKEILPVFMLTIFCSIITSLSLNNIHRKIITNVMKFLK